MPKVAKAQNQAASGLSMPMQPLLEKRPKREGCTQ